MGEKIITKCTSELYQWVYLIDCNHFSPDGALSIGGGSYSSGTKMAGLIDWSKGHEY